MRYASLIISMLAIVISLAAIAISMLAARRTRPSRDSVSFAFRAQTTRTDDEQTRVTKWTPLELSIIDPPPLDLFRDEVDLFGPTRGVPWAHTAMLDLAYSEARCDDGLCLLKACPRCGPNLIADGTFPDCKE